MKKSILYLFSAIMLVAVGCSESYDDSVLVGRVDKLENRVAQLEELCRQMNTNISSLQTIVNALENKDYVTGVTPITKGGETIGYTITFTKSQPITIYHGEDGKDGQNGTDGKDGHTPIIGVKQDTDGIYYWTLNGEWLLDDNGNKIKAQGLDGKDGKDGADGTDGTDGKDGENGTNGKDGSDGKDGITPQLKIENDYWYISYDNGSTWTQLGRAKGEDGANGTNGENGKNGENGDSFFQSVDTSNSDYVIFTLADETKLSLPRHKNLSISFDIADGAACMPSASIKVGYTLTGADSGTTIETIGDGGWKSTVTKTNVSSGYITVTAPESGGDGKVVMLATTSTGFTAMKAITFEEGVVMNVSDAYQASYENSTLKVTLRTNLKYTVNIPDNAKSWISVADTRATVRTETLTFTIQENPEENPARSATIRLIGECGDVLQSFVIMQDYQPSSSPIVFADANVKKVCVEKFDTNGDGELSEKEAAAVTSITGYFFGNYAAAVKTFNELKYFTKLKTIYQHAFYGCESLTSISIPSNVTAISSLAFSFCPKMKDVYITDLEKWFSTNLGDGTANPMGEGANLWLNGNLVTDYTYPEGTKTIGYHLAGCTSIINVTIPNSVISIVESAFSYCTNLKNISIPNGITTINASTFYKCSSLTNISIPEGVVSILGYAFQGCTNLTKVAIPASLLSISRGAFMNCANIDDVCITDLNRWLNIDFSDIDTNPLQYGANLWLNNNLVTNYSFPEGITAIGAQLRGCTSITSITIPNGVTLIDNASFSGCVNLKDITISDSVEEIGANVFYGCEKLETITIPASVKSIGNYTFQNCITLTTAYCKNPIPPTANSGYNKLFENCTLLDKIYVPLASVDAYKAADGWNIYADKIVGYDFNNN